MSHLSLQQAQILATRMSEDLAQDRQWFQGAPYVSVSECPCDCGHPPLSRGLECLNCQNFPREDAAPDGACYGGWIFTRHDSREE